MAQSCDITLTANAGVMLRCGGLKIFCDAFHRHKTDNFSTLTPDMQAKMAVSPEFSGANAMIFTHKHPDHYSRHLIAAAKALTPGAVIISPAPDFDDQILLSKERQRVELKGADIDFIKLEHEGAQYANVSNYGFLLRVNGFTVLSTGDSHTAEPKLAEWLCCEKIDLALLNFPWLTLRRGRDFIENVIKPGHVVFHHIPFEKDDLCGIRKACKKSLPLLGGSIDARLLTEPFQTERIILE